MSGAELVLALAAILLAACVGGCGGSSTVAPGGILYVSSLTGNYVAAFEGLPTLTGNLAPDRVLNGAATDIEAPALDGLTLDADRDSLYMACTGGLTPRILAFSAASSADGNVPPARRLAGTATSLSAPGALAVDAARDILYVADTKRILAFHGASSASGNVTPDRVLLFPADLRSLRADAAADRLYVSRSDLVIDIYEGASVVPSGVTPPARRLVPAGASSTWGLALDNARDVLYVADRAANAVMSWDRASAINGPLSPDRTLAGAVTLLSQPVVLRLDARRDELYAMQDTASPQEVKVWRRGSTVDGDQPPDRLLAGSRTNFASLSALAVDPLR